MALNSEMERFDKDVEAQESLRGELAKVGADIEAVVRFANSKGYDFTFDDVMAFSAGAAFVTAGGGYPGMARCPTVGRGTGCELHWLHSIQVF